MPPVITNPPMASWWLMHLGTWCTFTHCWYQWRVKSAEQVKRSALFDSGRVHCLSFWFHICYTHLTSAGFEYPVCHESLLTCFIIIFAWIVEHFLVHCYQQYVTVHHMPKCMSYYEAIDGLLRIVRAHYLFWFLTIYIYIYI